MLTPTQALFLLALLVGFPVFVVVYWAQTPPKPADPLEDQVERHAWPEEPRW